MSATYKSHEIVALSGAIDAAMDCGNVEEAIRLSSMQWAEIRRWLDDHGYPPPDNTDDETE